MAKTQEDFNLKNFHWKTKTGANILKFKSNIATLKNLGFKTSHTTEILHYRMWLSVAEELLAIKEFFNYAGWTEKKESFGRSSITFYVKSKKET